VTGSVKKQRYNKYQKAAILYSFMETSNKIHQQLTNPIKVWGKEEKNSRSCPVPAKAGVYACYFKEIPDKVPIKDCIRFGHLTLLYVGVSPARENSKQNLRTRIRSHYSGNASGSTLRLTLGCLLSHDLGVELRRTGKSGRLTFVNGEKKLTEWISKNAFVAWHIIDRPWEYEEDLINKISVPLNLDHNKKHKFHKVLSEIRSEAKKRARSSPVVMKI
jgi:GIY-YIG catalytic domain-containing protein